MVARSLWSPKGIAAVLDTSVHVRAYLVGAHRPSPSLLVQEQAGYAYDSFTSPDILAETEQLLVCDFEARSSAIRRWLDQFARQSRQVDPGRIPGDFAAQLRGDDQDNPILKTTLAVYAHEPEDQAAVQAALAGAGLYIVSTDTKHFPPGRNLHGWAYIRPHVFLRLVEEHAATSAERGNA